MGGRRNASGRSPYERRRGDGPRMASDAGMDVDRERARRRLERPRRSHRRSRSGLADGGASDRPCRNRATEGLDRHRHPRRSTFTRTELRRALRKSRRVHRRGELAAGVGVDDRSRRACPGPRRTATPECRARRFCDVGGGPHRLRGPGGVRPRARDEHRPGRPNGMAISP